MWLLVNENNTFHLLNHSSLFLLAFGDILLTTSLYLQKTLPLTRLDLLKGHPKHHSLNQAVAFPAGEAIAGFVATAPGEIRPVFTLCQPCLLFKSITLSYYNLLVPSAQSCWHLFLLTTSVIIWPGVIIVHSASLENGKVKKKVKTKKVKVLHLTPLHSSSSCLQS